MTLNETSKLNSRQLEEIVRTQLMWPSDRIARSRRLDMVRAVDALHQKKSEVVVDGTPQREFEKAHSKPMGTNNDDDGDKTVPTTPRPDQEELVVVAATGKKSGPIIEAASQPCTLPTTGPVTSRKLLMSSPKTCQVGSRRDQPAATDKSSSSRSEDGLDHLRNLQQEYNSLRTLLCSTRADLESIGRLNQSDDEELCRPLSQLEKLVASRTEKVAHELSRVTSAFRARVEELTEVARVVQVRLEEFQQVSTGDVVGVAETQRHLSSMQKRIQGIQSAIAEVK